MVKEMKCTNCGSKKLKRANFSIGDSMDMPLPMHIFICEECGHIELYEDKNNIWYGPQNK